MPVVLVLVAMTLVGIMVIAQLGVGAVDAARARTAADAAALAGAADGRAAAGRIAEANDGALIDFVRRGEVVEVVVQVGRARARARAEATVVWVPAA